MLKANTGLVRLFAICRSRCGRVVKLLTCGTRGPGFDSRPSHLNFQRLVISCFQVAIWLKYRDVHPQHNLNQPILLCVQYRFTCIQICYTKQLKYKIKYGLLHHSRTLTNLYICIGGTCMYKSKRHFKRTAFIKARVAQTVVHQARNFQVVGSSPTFGKDFFILYFADFDALLVCRLVPYKYNQA